MQEFSRETLTGYKRDMNLKLNPDSHNDSVPAEDLMKKIKKALDEEKFTFDENKIDESSNSIP